MYIMCKLSLLLGNRMNLYCLFVFLPLLQLQLKQPFLSKRFDIRNPSLNEDIVFPRILYE